MALSVTDSEAEALFNGSDDLDEDLADVADILSAVKAAALTEPETDFSSLFAAAIRESRLTPIERFANQQVTITEDWTPRVLPRLAIGVAALFMLVAISSGLAYAANGAKPGDVLWGLDRALEAVGIGNGGVAERLGEAQALLAVGDVPMGLTHAVTVVEGTPAGESAAPAIEAAVTRLENGTAGAHPHAADQVGDLLEYIHDQHEDGEQVEGAQVVILAHLIGGRPESPGKSDDAPGRDPEGPPDTTPGQGPPDITPGQGPPDTTPGQGPPDTTPGQGPPDSTPGQGPPDTIPGQGPPETPGPPDGGPPGQSGGD